MTNIAKPGSMIDRQRKALDTLLEPTKFSSATRALDLYYRNGIFGRIKQTYERIMETDIPGVHALPLALYVVNQHMMSGKLPPVIDRVHFMDHSLNSFTLAERTDWHSFMENPEPTYTAVKPQTLQRWAEAIALIDMCKLVNGEKS